MSAKLKRVAAAAGIVLLMLVMLLVTGWGVLALLNWDHANPTLRNALAAVYGIVSLIFWALMIIVSFKYAFLVMRAHNRGDGGGMALAALIQRRGVGREPHADHVGQARSHVRFTERFVLESLAER